MHKTPLNYIDLQTSDGGGPDQSRWSTFNLPDCTFGHTFVFSRIGFAWRINSQRTISKETISKKIYKRHTRSKNLKSKKSI